MATYRILSLDGGGIRGLITAIILQRLEQAVPGWLDKVDLFAGTSTGGIISLGLASGLTPTQARQLYYERGPRIFYNNIWHNISHAAPLLGAKHPNDHLREELTSVFGNRRLGDLPRKVLISSFDLGNGKELREGKAQEKRSWKAKFFHNFEDSNPNASKTESDAQFYVVDVALYTSAAPTFFPTVDGYTDGGVVANNPSMAAVAQTQDMRVVIEPRPALKDVAVLSIGTGTNLSRIIERDLDWGYVQWGWQVRLLKILMDGVLGVPDYQCRQILADNNYLRIAPELPPGENFDVDDVSRLDEIVAFAESLQLDEYVDWLRNSYLQD